MRSHPDNHGFGLEPRTPTHPPGEGTERLGSLLGVLGSLFAPLHPSLILLYAPGGQPRGRAAMNSLGSGSSWFVLKDTKLHLLN